MHLLIDIGNTCLKWAVWDGQTLTPMQSARHGGAIPIDVHAAWDGLEGIEHILVGSVGPEAVVDAVGNACASYWRRAPLRIDAGRLARDSVVRIAYADPRLLGTDRWLALSAAHAQHIGPKLIVDAGTAITYDLLLGDGRHLGGLILPGIEMMRRSLLEGTLIPPHEAIDGTQPWGVSSGEAIAAASIQGPAALAERLWNRLHDLAGEEPSLILTGGDAERLLPAIVRPATHRPDLVLQGLALYT